ncbi:MAG: hypothetical protein JWM80_286 [Cyanobacteria bacterium RYN_339]|nr:hypothetical protein [Cyanobacteria bacterium RYN_339]
MPSLQRRTVAAAIQLSWFPTVIALGLLGCQPSPVAPVGGGGGAATPKPVHSAPAIQPSWFPTVIALPSGDVLERDVTFDVDPLQGSAFEHATREALGVVGVLQAQVTFPDVTHQPGTGLTTVTVAVKNGGAMLGALELQVAGDLPLVDPSGPVRSGPLVPGQTFKVRLTFDNPGGGAFSAHLVLAGLRAKATPTPGPSPSAEATATPTPEPTATPTAAPTATPTPTPAPTATPTPTPTPVPTATPTPGATPTPAPTATPTPGPTPAGGLLLDFEGAGATADFIDPNDEGYSYTWMPRVDWKIVTLNGSKQYEHDGLSSTGNLSFRRYKGAGLGTANGALPDHYMAELDVTPIQSYTYAPTGDQGTQVYYLDPTHYVEVLIKPTYFEVWQCDGGVPFGSAGWTRLYFADAVNNANEARHLGAEIDCTTHTLKAFFGGQLMTTLMIPMLTTQPHYMALRGTGNIVAHDNVHVLGL